MSPFFANVGKVQKIDQFAGGKNKTSKKLNQIVDAVNVVTSEAQRAKAADTVLANLENMQPVLIRVIGNGASALVKIPMEIQPT